MKEKFLVIVNQAQEDEIIYYCGDAEVLAYKKFKELPQYPPKQILKANVELKKVMNTDFIVKYEIIERKV